MPIPQRTPLLTLMRLEQAQANHLRDVLEKSAHQVGKDLTALGDSGNVLTRAQLEAQKASIKAVLAQDFSNIENAVVQGRKDAASAASEVLSRYEAELQSLVMSPQAVKRVARSEARRAAEGVEAAVRRMEGSSYVPLSSRVYRTRALTEGWVDDKINQALVSGWDARRLAREMHDFISPSVPGGASYAANRLARTEINNAFHASSVKRYEDSGLVDGVDWHLSSSHPEGDICDTLQAESPYEPKKVPKKPHPHCYCYLTPHLPTEDEFLDNLLAGKYDDEPWHDDVDHERASSRTWSPKVFSDEEIERGAYLNINGHAAKDLDGYNDFAGLTSEQSKMARDYQAPENARWVNGRLRGFEQPLDYDPFEFGRTTEAKMIEIMDEVTNAGSVTADATLYRGVVMSKELLEEYKPGAVVTDAGFMSTSASSARAERFARRSEDGWLLNVRVREGQKAGPGFMGLDEIILPRGTSTRILSVDESNKTIEMEVI